MVKEKKETWMPHAGHFICSSHCRFKLNTHVNGYIISTVGEYVPDSQVRRIHREVHGWDLTLKGDAEEYDYIQKTGGVEGYGDEIGCDRKYETMVFVAQKSKRKCCPYEMKSPSNIDFAGYMKAEEAYKGHMKMVKKYKNKNNKKISK